MKSAEAEGITGVIEHIALFSESSEERLQSLTALRKKAAECNRLKEFDGLLFDYKVDNYEISYTESDRFVIRLLS